MVRVGLGKEGEGEGGNEGEGERGKFKGINPILIKLDGEKERGRRLSTIHISSAKLVKGFENNPITSSIEPT